MHRTKHRLHIKTTIGALFFCLLVPVVRADEPGRSPALPLALALRSPAERLGLEQKIPELTTGKAVTWELDASHYSEIAAAAAVVVEAPMDVLVAEVQSLEILRKRGVLMAMGKFSEPVSGHDLDKLEIPQQTLDAMASAKFRSSDVKLSSAEIAAIRRVKPEQREVLYKSFLLRRIRAWREKGVDGLDQYHDKKRPIEQAKETGEMLASLGKTRPNGPMPVATRYQYWSVEQFGSLKPVIALNDMTVTRGFGTARIEIVQIYSNHYFDGLVTALDFAEVRSESGPATLVRLAFYSRLDLFEGLLGGLKRRFGRSKTVEELGKNLEQMRATYGPQTARREDE